MENLSRQVNVNGVSSCGVIVSLIFTALLIIMGLLEHLHINKGCMSIQKLSNMCNALLVSITFYHTIYLLDIHVTLSHTLYDLEVHNYQQTHMIFMNQGLHDCNKIFKCCMCSMLE